MKFLSFCIFYLISTALYCTTYTVNSLANTTTGTGTSGTLRWCITQANSSAGTHTINFSVAGTIAINSSLTALPSLIQTITIDGSTAPGYTGSPVVFIDGTGSAGITGITISAANCQVYGLEIYGFALSGIRISSDIADNYVIGGLNKGNVIRDNTQYGITNEGADNGFIAYNYIGTNFTGTACSANGYDGIILTNTSSSNSIQFNLISCNGGSSIQINNNSSSNIVQGNTIGPILNNCSNNTFRGIKLENGASNNTIGGISLNQANKITGVNFWAVEITGSNSIGNKVSGNIMNCNGLGGIELAISANAAYPAPVIVTSTGTLASGTASPNATIEIFRNQVLSSVNCSTPPSTTNSQGTDYLGTTIADASGNWAISGAFSGFLVATATSPTGNTSKFSASINTGITAVNTNPCIGLVPLPVSLLSYSIRCSENRFADLYWETASESNNQYFTISRSTDGILFEEIATVPGNYTSSQINSYQYTDLQALNGNIYYRLSQTDVNGTTKILGNSVWQSNWCGQQRDTAFSFPNPVLQNSLINIFITDEYALFNGGYYDMTGRLLFPLQANLHQGWNIISTDLSALSDGNYLLMGTTAKNEKLIREMIAKQGQ